MAFTPLANANNRTVPSKGMVVRIMTEQTVDETVSVIVCPSASFRNHKFSLITSDGSITGNAQIETAPSPDYAGVWSPLGGGPIDLSTISGVLEEVFEGIFTAMRVRITTVVAGGNLSVDYQGS